MSVAELRQRFLRHHEDVLKSSVATINRYRSATQHLLDYGESERVGPAHTVSAARFATFLRHRDVAPNGHPNTRRRKLHDKGVRFILEVCRSLYGFAQRMRHLPPYTANPFGELGLERMRNTDAKRIFVFVAETEQSFLNAAPGWDFPIHATLSKTGMRPGELAHLLVEEVDLKCGWLHVRNKPELGWSIKTGCERSIPLVPELCNLLGLLTAGRSNGPVFVRPEFCLRESAIAHLNRAGLERLLKSRIAEFEQSSAGRLGRTEKLRIARTVWRDAGAIKNDMIRRSFIRVAKKARIADATCPKSWRHSYATLLQDANVDPLIRQITMGHKPQGANAALGMTSVYTHTRAATQHREICRALQLWPDSLHLIRNRSAAFERV
ncbi:MAG: site-specific integrase [Planctomycetaceae bacterium]|nr:site-specific integrase [Planctomycetaceae bacterium]